MGDISADTADTADDANTDADTDAAAANEAVKKLIHSVSLDIIAAAAAKRRDYLLAEGSMTTEEIENEMAALTGQSVEVEAAA